MLLLCLCVTSCWLYVFMCRVVLWSSGADSRNEGFQCWCLLSEHALAVGLLHLSLASVTVHRMWTMMHMRPLPCHLILQSEMGLAVRPEIARLRDDPELLAAVNKQELDPTEGPLQQEKKWQSTEDVSSLVFVRRFSKLDSNVYCCEQATDGRRYQPDCWSFLPRNQVESFRVPSDYQKVRVSFTVN